MCDKPLAVATMLFSMLGTHCRAEEASDQIPGGKPVASGGLSASYSGISDAELAELKLPPQLKRLDLRDSKITDAGLVQLKELTQLQFLSLNGTQISDAGLVQLQGFSHLKFLSLNDTKVTDAGMKNLAGMKHL